MTQIGQIFQRGSLRASARRYAEQPLGAAALYLETGSPFDLPEGAAGADARIPMGFVQGDPSVFDYDPTADGGAGMVHVPAGVYVYEFHNLIGPVDANNKLELQLAYHPGNEIYYTFAGGKQGKNDAFGILMVPDDLDVLWTAPNPGSLHLTSSSGGYGWASFVRLGDPTSSTTLFDGNY